MSKRTERWVEQNLKRQGRRWFLTAAGIAIALPYLEAFPEKTAQAAAGSKRLFLFHMPAGVNVTTWAPQGTGTSFSFGPAMKGIDDAGLKSKVAVVTGTNAIGGPRGHTCGISGVLTGVGCQGDTTQNATSFDQVVAQSFAGQTRFPSVELGTSHTTENPNAEAGYSTVLKDNLNWSSPSTPLSREIEPLKAFNRLFAGLPSNGSSPQPQAMSVKDAMRKSMLDYTLTEGDELRARTGSADKMKLDQYLDGLRELEKSIQITPTVGQTGMCTPGAIPSAGRPSDVQVHVKLMLDIAIAAFKCDLTRVITFAYEHTTTEIRHPFLGVNVGWHTSVTHHA